MVHEDESRTFDDMLIEDLEPSDEEQLAVLGGAKQSRPDDEESPRN
jgi:hypothetical protein